MTKLDFKDIYLNINQKVSANGILTLDGWLGSGLIGHGFSDIKNSIDNGQIASALEQIVDITKLSVGGKGGLNGITVSRPSAISQSIKVEAGKEKEEPKNIFRGESKDATKVEMLNPIYNSNGKFWVKK